MAYTSKQLTMAWTAVHNGVAPDNETLAQLQLRTNPSFSDGDALSYVLNSADGTTALAVLSYQFFTGKSPTKAGMDYLVNSPTNANDLNDPYYAKFGLENRYINFAANLGVAGEGKDAFAARYGAMSFADYVASIYETIIGKSYATAAGIDPAKAIADIASRQAAILATAQSSGMITPGMTQAQIDVAVKAATAGYLLGEAIKADVGLYAAAANNFMLAVAQGTAAYNVDITTTYKPVAGSGSQGTGGAIDVAPASTTLPGGPPPSPEPTGRSYTQSAGPDTLTGDDGDDTFAATDLTFNVGDVIKGGAGNDSLTITASTGGVFTVPSASVSGVETANISNNAGLILDTTTWTGLTTLKTTSIGETELKASTTTDVNATITLGSQHFYQYGGHDVTVNATGATTGDIVTGEGTYSTGAVVINRETTGAVVANNIVTQGGTTVSITATATNAVNTTQQNGSINVKGGPLTTSVTVKAPKAVAADATHAGVVGQHVIIQNLNYNSTTEVGPITSIDVDGATDVVIWANAVTTLKLSHVTGDITFAGAALTTPAVTTLNLTLNDMAGGKLDDYYIYTTLNVTTGAQASSLSKINSTTLTTLNVGGVSALTLTSATDTTNLQTVTTSGAGGLIADLSPLTALTSVNTTASTGASTLTIDGTKTTFTGGAGGDTVTLSGTSITKAIDMGAGDDTLVLADGMGVPGVILNGGAGTADVLSIQYADAIALSGSNAFANQVTGFERLLIRNGPITTLDVTQLGDYHYFISEHGLGITLKGLVSGDTLQFKDFATATKLDAGDFGGANDTLNIVLANPGGANPNYGWLQGDVIENLAISIIDTAATTGTHTWQARSTSVKTVTVTGNADLNLTLDSLVLTSVDASGLTDGGLSFTTWALTGAATIKGSATGENTVTFSAATGGVITYEGGSGNDTVDAGNSLSGNIIHLGDGTNYFTGYGGATSAITAGSGDDYIRVDNGGATINAGNGSNRVLATDAIGSTITTGTGDDQIFVGGGANLVNVGSGDDYLEIGAVDAASATVFTAITGIGAGDEVFVTTNHANAMGSKLTGQTTLAGYLALANDVAGTTNTLHWFEIGSDIYILSDVSDATTFVAGADSVVKLTGAAGLNLNAATVANGLITF